MAEDATTTTPAAQEPKDDDVKKHHFDKKKDKKEEEEMHSSDVASPLSKMQIQMTDSRVARVKKRIIICCDGTWQDGILRKNRYRYTNVLKLSRAINHEDARHNPAIPQIVFYQAGIGSDDNWYSEYVEGATGASLGEKVQEAYGFIASNYQPGDDIFIFGFSRGAYTARMIAEFIGELGVMDRTDMDNFASVFINFQKRGKSKDPEEIKELDEKLEKWTNAKAPGKVRADWDRDTFSIKCVGVFDTVGSLGLPEEITLKFHKTAHIFGFKDTNLGEHIQNAFHAMAINERRGDFNVSKFHQTEGGRRKGQVLKQCWFSGEHSDIGGGWQAHDLSDITLAWMCSNIRDMLSLDFTYLGSTSDPVAPYGEQPPHNSLQGMFTLANRIQREMPTTTDNVTCEVIHPSVLEQKELIPELRKNLDANPSLVCEYMPTELEVKEKWNYVEGKNPAIAEGGLTQAVIEEGGEDLRKSDIRTLLQKGEHTVKSAIYSLTHKKVMQDQAGSGIYKPTWAAQQAEESAFGPFIKEINGDS